MKRLLWGTLLVALVSVVPVHAMAAVDISIGISLPPPIVFPAPPAVIVVPETPSVYVVPGIEIDLFFWNGWWWRPWEGRWYRSRYYDHGWGYYDRVPSFYFDVDPGWRGFYRDHNWHGRRWDYHPIPHKQLHQNWQGWQKDRHWERHGTWGVQNYKPRPQPEKQALRHQRQQEYQQRPEVRQHQQQREHLKQQQGQQQRQQQQGPPQVRQSSPHPQEKGQRPQDHPQVEQPRSHPQEKGQRPQHSQPHGKSEGGEGDRNK